MATQFEGGAAPKSFWKKPEGVTGLLFLLAIVGGGGYLIYSNWGAILSILGSTLAMAATIAVIGLLIYLFVDPKTRALLSYMYKSVMRSITSWFVTIDPVGILKSYVDELQSNLVKMREQIGKIRGQMRHLQTLMETNNREIDNQLKLAAAARDKGKDQQLVLSSRKAARLRESNGKYQQLLNKMDILYRILTKMHANSEILLEDTKDQVFLKEQERKAIRASHSAMKSAMSVINGNPDQRAMFDMAMEQITEDVANKVGEMERFMEMSASFMDTVDLQNGVFEEEGLRMLEKWEEQSTLMLMSGQPESDTLDLDSESRTRSAPTASEQKTGKGYDQFFE